MYTHFKPFAPHFSFKLIFILILSVQCQIGQAIEKKVEYFDLHTWKNWSTNIKQPFVVIFSMQDCSHCPAVISNMSETLKKSKVPIIVVIMDTEDPVNLLQEKHYQLATRLFIFKGQTAALQYSVNPHWRGITPYVVLFSPQELPHFILGKPSNSDMFNWLSHNNIQQ